MKVTWESIRFEPAQVRSRYVRFCSGVFYFCEVDRYKQDVRQGEVEESELPPEIAAAARQCSGVWPSYVGWPL